MSETTATRAAQIEALQVEREQLTRRPPSPTQKRRLTEIDDVLDSVSDTPRKPARQKAVARPKPAPVTDPPADPPASPGAEG